MCLEKAYRFKRKTMYGWKVFNLTHQNNFRSPCFGDRTMKENLMYQANTVLYQTGEFPNHGFHSFTRKKDAEKMAKIFTSYPRPLRKSKIYIVKRVRLKNILWRGEFDGGNSVTAEFITILPE